MNPDLELIDHVCKHVSDLEDHFTGLGTGWLVSMMRALEQHVDPFIYAEIVSGVRNELQEIIDERGYGSVQDRQSNKWPDDEWGRD